MRTPDGRPIVGALVFVNTARPRVGPSVTCPSCYLDCRKRATTDARGAFTVPRLDPSLIFSVGAAADGYAARFTESVEPTGGPLDVVLEPRPPMPGDPRRVVRARVVDSQGRPIVGALVEPIGHQTGRSPDDAYSQHFGPFGVDPVVTGADGRLVLGMTVDADAVLVQVEARDFARKAIAVSTGGAEEVLRLGPGRTLRGRLVRDGRPIAGAVVAAVQVDRRVDTFVGERTAETDRLGRFLLEHLPPAEALVFYGKLQGLAATGAVAERTIPAAAEGTILDLGDVAVAPGLTVSGRVVTADGRPLPADAKIRVQRRAAWDWVEAELPADGHFTLGPLPREIVEVSVDAPGYSRAAQDANLRPEADWMRRNGASDLRFVLAPAHRRSSSRRD
ncbi:MAG: carboxypeptidase-like regulatory domain-containing protein [Vicinamibacteria bacterium]